MFENSRSERFNVAKWKSLSLESFSMPYHPHSGRGYSGVRDLGWTFKEAPYYIKQFMLDVIHVMP